MLSAAICSGRLQRLSASPPAPSAPLLRPRFKRVLVLGLGGGGVPAFFQTRKEFADIEVVAVDISAAVARAATACFDLEASANINVKVDDAEAYLRREVRGKTKSGVWENDIERERERRSYRERLLL